MANKLKMAKVEAILALWRRGWKNRRIARELGVDRGTVAKYVREAQEGSKSANLPTGSGQNQPNPPTGSEGQNQPNLPTGSEGQNRPNPPTGSSGPQSKCEPFREFITESLDQGLSAQRIWQDLRAEHGFSGGYDSVKRFARKLRSTNPLPFRRIERAPGEEAQVDFGVGAYVIDSEGRRRRPWVFRIVLSHSRKGYSEAVFHQSAEAFIRALENAFHHFGGVVATLIIDNLLAAVKRADWYDPELNPKIIAFAEHYGVTFMPTRPYTPRHKGKVERGIDYVKNNALKGRTFESLAEQNQHLLDWEKSVADTRIHGTTRKQVGKVFAEVERPQLKPLPPDRFPFFHEAERKVHRDGHVEVERAYYSAPPEYLSRKVWVRWDTRMVRIFNQRMEQIAVHVKAERGRFKTQRQHIVDEKISGVERGAAHYLKHVRRIGPNASLWSEALIKERGVAGVRVLVGLTSLGSNYSWPEIDRACEIAWSHRSFNLRTIRELLKRKAPKQEEFEFMDRHPIIRSLTEYQELVRDAFREE